MARSLALFALILVSIVQMPSAFATGDQGQSQPSSSAQPARKPLKAGAAKSKAKAVASHKPPKVKAPAAKPVQPQAAVPAAPSKAVPPAPDAATPADDKADAVKPVEAKAAPHFASLRSDKVFLRSGPSADFPIQWVFVRRGLPVEILATFDIWRKVRDFDGTEGWVHQQMLTGRRSVLVTGGVRDLRHDADAASPVVAQLEAGVVAALSHCNPGWCELKAGGYKGWMKREDVWGLEPDEVIP